MTQDRAPDEGLPPLPEPFEVWGEDEPHSCITGFTAEQMRSYAQAALQAERERAERAEQDQKRQFAAGIEAAAKWVDKRFEDWDAEHGCTDPSTGCREYGNQAKDDYACELQEIAEGIRAIANAASAQGSGSEDR
jgi:hypothetical protein